MSPTPVLVATPPAAERRAPSRVGRLRRRIVALAVLVLAALGGALPAAGALAAQGDGFSPYAYRRRILLQLPAFRADDYRAIKARYGYDYTYPQAFAFDWKQGLLFICRASTGGSNHWSWIETYKWSTGQYLGSFSVGSNTSEGLVVTYKGDQRLLWIRGDKTGTVAAYDITQLPPALSRLDNPVEVHPVDLYLDFSIYGGIATVEQRSAPTGVPNPRNDFMRFQLPGWTPLGAVRFDAIDTGLGTTTGLNADSDQIPKRQGFVSGPTFYMSMMGAYYHKGGSSLPIQYTGPRVFSLDGRRIADGVVEPQAAIDILAAHGVQATRIEAEGAVFAPPGQSVLPPGTIVSLTMTHGATDPGADRDGILFLEEFSHRPDAIDFSPAARPYGAQALSTTALMSPAAMGADKDPLTGKPFTDLGAELDFMAHLSLPQRRLDTGKVPLRNIDGTPFPPGAAIDIENQGGGSFTLRSVVGGAARTWRVTGTPATGKAAARWQQTPPS